MYYHLYNLFKIEVRIFFNIFTKDGNSISNLKSTSYRGYNRHVTDFSV